MLSPEQLRIEELTERIIKRMQEHGGSIDLSMMTAEPPIPFEMETMLRVSRQTCPTFSLLQGWLPFNKPLYLECYEKQNQVNILFSHPFEGMTAKLFANYFL